MNPRFLPGQLRYDLSSVSPGPLPGGHARNTSPKLKIPLPGFICFHEHDHRNLPTMLHVLRFVHANGQFDLQIIWTTFGNSHLVKLRLLRTVGSRMEHHLEAEH